MDQYLKLAKLYSAKNNQFQVFMKYCNELQKDFINNLAREFNCKPEIFTSKTKEINLNECIAKIEMKVYYDSSSQKKYFVIPLEYKIINNDSTVVIKRKKYSIENNMADIVKLIEDKAEDCFNEYILEKYSPKEN